MREDESREDWLTRISECRGLLKKIRTNPSPLIEGEEVLGGWISSPRKLGGAMVQLATLFRRTKGKTGSVEPRPQETYNNTKEEVELSSGGGHSYWLK